MIKLILQLEDGEWRSKLYGQRDSVAKIVPRKGGCVTNDDRLLRLKVEACHNLIPTQPHIYFSSATDSSSSSSTLLLVE